MRVFGGGKTLPAIARVPVFTKSKGPQIRDVDRKKECDKVQPGKDPALPAVANRQNNDNLTMEDNPSELTIYAVRKDASCWGTAE